MSQREPKSPSHSPLRSPNNEINWTIQEEPVSFSQAQQDHGTTSPHATFSSELADKQQAHGTTSPHTTFSSELAETQQANGTTSPNATFSSELAETQRKDCSETDPPSLDPEWKNQHIKHPSKFVSLTSTPTQNNLSPTPSPPAVNQSHESLPQHEQHQQLSLAASASSQDRDPPILKLQKKTKSEPSSSHSQQFVDAAGSQVQQFVVDRTIKRSSPRLSAQCIFTIEECVQVFYISPDGSVQVPDETSSLKFVRLHRSQPNPAMAGRRDSDTPSAEPLAFLHVGDWLYPLIPGCSPALITAYGTYLFPDLRAQQQGAAVALALPQFVTSDEREEFELLLEYYANVEDAVDRVGAADPGRLEASRSSESTMTWEGDENEGTMALTGVSLTDLAGVRGVVSAIKILSIIIVIAIKLLTEFGVWAIRSTAGTIRAVATRSSRAHEVDPHILRGVLYARSASDRTVVVTARIVENLQEAAVNLSVRMFPRPSLVMPSFLLGNGSRIASVLRLTAVLSVSAYGGVADVYRSLTDASNTLFDAFHEETVKTVEHRYGDRYGDLTREAFDTAQNVKRVVTHTYNITSLAFVPMTIESTMNKGLHTNKEKSLGVKIDDYGEELMAVYRVQRESGETKDEPKDEVKKKKHTKMSTEYGSTHSTAPTDEDQPSTSTSWRGTGGSRVGVSSSSPSLTKKVWRWSSSTAVDTTTLQAKATRKESVTSAFWLPRRRSSSGAHRLESSSSAPADSQTRAVGSRISTGRSVGAAPSSADAALAGQQSAMTTSTVDSASSVVSTKRPDSKILTPLSSQSQSFVRRRSSMLAPTRRQSVFLSTRRQSLHVMTAMANAVERQSWLKATATEDAPLMAGADIASRRSKFKTAAQCVTKAKIRRGHREKSRENHLVVVQHTETVPRLSVSSSGLSV